MKTILTKFRKKNQESGFITFEVIISILIALAFVAVSMQSLVFAMAMKVQAQEKQRANQLIQEDIERINQLGSNTGLVATCNANAYVNGYAQALWATLPVGVQTKNIIEKIESDGSVGTGGKQLALRRFHVSSTANNSTFPHRTLKVGYQVWDWVGGAYVNSNGTALAAGDQPIAETYVEIIPDVALQCP
ncbi:MAG: hypothetical protein AAGF83_02430 [Cyanobacteria bacterium P01_G01_bin.67]